MNIPTVHIVVFGFVVFLLLLALLSGYFSRKANVFYRQELDRAEKNFRACVDAAAGRSSAFWPDGGSEDVQYDAINAVWAMARHVEYIGDFLEVMEARRSYEKEAMTRMDELVQAMGSELDDLERETSEGRDPFEISLICANIANRALDLHRKHGSWK